MRRAASTTSWIAELIGATPAFLDTALLLDHFDGDRRRLAIFTDEPTPAERSDPRSLGSFISFAIAVDDLRFGGEEHSPQWLGRAVRLLLLDQVLPPTFRSIIEADLGLPDGAARRMAMSRARSEQRPMLLTPASCSRYSA